MGKLFVVVVPAAAVTGLRDQSFLYSHVAPQYSSSDLALSLWVAFEMQTDVVTWHHNCL